MFRECLAQALDGSQHWQLLSITTSVPTVTGDTVTGDVVTNEVVTSDAATSDAVTFDAVTNDAVTGDETLICWWRSWIILSAAAGVQMVGCYINCTECKEYSDVGNFSECHRLLDEVQHCKHFINALLWLLAESIVVCR